MGHPFDEHELRELMTTLRDERAAARTQRDRDRWTHAMALLLVLTAAVTAFASFKSSSYANKVTLSQAQASDTWAYYEYKSIKQRITELEARTAAEPERTLLHTDMERYHDEEIALRHKAEGLEAERDQAALHVAPLAFSVAGLQIALALLSVCLITRRKSLGGAAAIIALVGSAYLVYGLYLV
jgi:hypothetical protein